MALSDNESSLLKECIQSHERMIKYHRRQILDLRRKMECFEKIEMVPINLGICDESGR